MTDSTTITETAVRDIDLFLLGYDTRQREVMAAVVTAAVDHKSAPLAVRDSYRRGEWEIKAELQIRANREGAEKRKADRERIAARLADFNAAHAMR